MSRVRRTDAQVAGGREARRIAATLGADLRRSRRRRRHTQSALGERVGLTQGRISDLERGEGASAPLDTWVAIGLALDRPLAVSFTRDLVEEPRDAGHLRAQELLIGIARRTGRRVNVELPSRAPSSPYVIDVVLRDDRARTVVLVEIWNRLDDLGAAMRSTLRKASDADGLAVLAAGEGPSFRVATCWLLVDTAANRRLVGQYPGVLKARFPGSSVGWVRSVVEGVVPPVAPGLAWVDPRLGRIVPMRLVAQWSRH